MSVTQNYTITTSNEVWAHIKNAVLGRLEDKLRVAGLTNGLPDFLVGEVAGGAGALMAIHSATVLTREDTHGALDGENLKTVLFELHQMRILLNGGTPDLMRGKWRIEALHDALLFLENPK